MKIDLVGHVVPHKATSHGTYSQAQNKAQSWSGRAWLQIYILMHYVKTEHRRMAVSRHEVIARRLRVRNMMLKKLDYHERE